MKTTTNYQIESLFHCIWAGEMIILNGKLHKILAFEKKAPANPDKFGIKTCNSYSGLYALKDNQLYLNCLVFEGENVEYPRINGKEVSKRKILIQDMPENLTSLNGFVVYKNIYRSLDLKIPYNGRMLLGYSDRRSNTAETKRFSVINSYNCFQEVVFTNGKVKAQVDYSNKMSLLKEQICNMEKSGKYKKTLDCWERQMKEILQNKGSWELYRLLLSLNEK